MSGEERVFTTTFYDRLDIYSEVWIQRIVFTLFGILGDRDLEFWGSRTAHLGRSLNELFVIPVSRSWGFESVFLLPQRQ
jgi:hypothetical protein